MLRSLVSGTLLAAFCTATFAQSAPDLEVAGAPGARTPAEQEGIVVPSGETASVPVVLEGHVFDPEGAPAEGAVVVTSAGGQAVADADGFYRLEASVPIEAGGVQVTAVGRGSGRLLASTSVELSRASDRASVRPLSLAQGGTCPPAWLPTFGGQPGVSVSGFSAFIEALAVYDDGDGAALYAGGTFDSAGGAQTYYIARWDGSRWAAVGIGTSWTVYSLAVYDDGGGEALYAGGHFTSAGGVVVRGIAKWDGSSWSALGSGMNNDVLALAVYDDGEGPALYAGGDFTTAGTVEASRIAKWDGSSWSALGKGLGTGESTLVDALAVYDDGGGPALYAGGDFTTAGEVAASRIAKWDGSTWAPLGSGVAGSPSTSVHALAVYDDGGGAALYAGGSFTSAGGVAANRVAKWDGSSWAALGSGVIGVVHALAVHDDGGGPALYAGGGFAKAGGGAANHIAKWDGSTWAPLGSGLDGNVHAVAVYDDGGGAALYAAGGFTTAGGAVALRIAEWDASSWTALGNGMNGEVRALAVYDDGGGPALHAGGQFTWASGGAVSFVAKWDGSSWSALASGTDLPVDALAVYDDGGGAALYAAGSFTKAGGVQVNGIAKWDGSTWTALGSGISSPGTLYVRALAVYDDGSGEALYAGGNFPTAGGVAVNRIARWDGSSWAALGSGVSGFVYALTVHDDGGGAELYAGGDFTTAGGMAANYIAKWDGSSWAPLGSGVGGDVLALGVYDDGSGAALYAGGAFTTAGGMAANYIAKWDGSSWAALGSGMNRSVESLATYDDGSGTALYAGGWFFSAGGVAASRIARWDGSSWVPLGSGVIGGNIPSYGVHALTVHDDGGGEALFLGGGFTGAIAGSGDSYVAKWGPLDTAAPVLTCPGDLTVLLGQRAPIGGGPATAVSFSVTAIDDCDPSPSLVCVPASGSVFDWGTTTVTCTAQDASGNVSMCDFEVTVRPEVPRVSGSPGGGGLPGTEDPDGLTSPAPSRAKPTPLIRLHRGAELRQGSGTNPLCLVSANVPRAGRAWTALVDVSADPGATASILFLSDRPVGGGATGQTSCGELLIDPSAPHLLATSVVDSPSAAHAHRVSLAPWALLGRELHAQALIVGQDLVLTNAVDLVVRR